MLYREICYICYDPITLGLELVYELLRMCQRTITSCNQSNQAAPSKNWMNKQCSEGWFYVAVFIYIFDFTTIRQYMSIGFMLYLLPFLTVRIFCKQLVQQQVCVCSSVCIVFVWVSEWMNSLFTRGPCWQWYQVWGMFTCVCDSLDKEYYMIDHCTILHLSVV